LDVYEAMLIVIPELDEEQVENTIARFRTIDHRTDGYYVVMEFTAGERTLVELKRILRVSDDVLRHMVVKLPPTYAHRPLPAEAAS
jgi:small subunit ribosomal protein S6